MLAALPIETCDEAHRLRGPVLPAYDAVHLDLAMQHGLALATRDRAAAKAEPVNLIET